MGLSTEAHPKPYPFGWLHKDMDLKVTRKYKFDFTISAQSINEIICDVVLLDVSEIVMAIGESLLM